MHLVIASCGYVERARLSWLSFSTQEDYGTRYKALSALAHQLLHAYRSHQGLRARERCCGQDILTPHCPQCGKRRSSPFRPERFADWVDHLHNQTADTFLDFEEFGPWWCWPTPEDLFKFPRENIIKVDEKFEEMMCWTLQPGGMPIEWKDDLLLYQAEINDFCPWNRFDKKPLSDELEAARYGITTLE